MALVEARLGHAEAANAWRARAVRWLERATADPTDPEVLGGMNTPDQRAMFRLTRDTAVMTRRPLEYLVKRPYIPSWRQVLELNILREEVDATFARISGTTPSP